MRLIESLANEFYELAAEYRNKGPEGVDVIDMFMEFTVEYDHFDDETDKENFTVAWAGFVEEHRNDATVMEIGLVLYLLVTYWPQGQRLFQSVSPLEKILLREIVAEMDYQIRIRSAMDNGNDPVPA